MHKIIGSLLVLVSAAALADGVPLITPGPAVQMDSPAMQRAAQQANFIKAHGIVFNENAFGANVLTVMVDGKEHRFVGAMAARPGHPVKGQPVFDTWEGKETSLAGGTLALSRDVKSGYISGTMSLGGHTFQITPDGGTFVMIEWQPNRESMIAAPSAPASGGGK